MSHANRDVDHVPNGTTGIGGAIAWAMTPPATVLSAAAATKPAIFDGLRIFGVVVSPDQTPVFVSGPQHIAKLTTTIFLFSPPLFFFASLS